MTAPKKSKFSVSLVFANTDEQTCTMYQKHFRDVQKTRVERMDILTGEDCLIIPMPSCFGLYSQKSFIHTFMQHLGEELADKIQHYIQKKYLGEQPLGSAFLLRNPQKKSSFRYILVVALFRALTCAGDNMSHLDPQQIPKDYAYNAMRGCLLTLLRHNTVSDRNKINTVYCPDFFKVRQEAPGGEKLTLNEFDETIRQMVLATRVILEPSKIPRDWAHALVITTQIVKAPEVTEDLTPMVESGALEVRGLYSTAELDQVMTMTTDHKNKDRQEAAIKVLAASLHRTDDHFSVPKSEITHRIMSQKGGCLALLVDMVVHRKITVHKEIPIEEITVGEPVGEGSAAIVFRGTWRGRHVAIKQFKKEISYEEFIKELSIMCVVQHPNLVKCHGGVTLDDKKWIISELMQMNLSTVLTSKAIEMDLGIVAKIAINAADGIEYLHRHCNLIHRDLKSMNLLINTYKTHLDVKVCDFALSRVINKKEHMTGNVGTISWIAPEVIDGRKKYNEKADVYSFGIILWELVSRSVPFQDIPPLAIPLAVLKGKRPPIPRDCPADLKRLITGCWSPKPKQRPSMTTVIQMLRKFHRGLHSLEKAQVTIDVTNIIAYTPKRKEVNSVWTTYSQDGPMPPLTDRNGRNSGREAKSTSSAEKEKNSERTVSELTERSSFYSDAVSSDEESL